MLVALLQLLESRALLDSTLPTYDSESSSALRCQPDAARTREMVSDNPAEISRFNEERTLVRKEMFSDILSDRPSNLPVNAEPISSHVGFSDT
jgi:hypothetical protein